MQEKAKFPSTGIPVIGKEKAIAKEPTLQDVFDKKSYYNPGKIKSRLLKQLEKFENQLAESEEKRQLCNYSLITGANDGNRNRVGRVC